MRLLNPQTRKRCRRNNLHAGTCARDVTRAPKNNITHESDILVSRSQKLGILESLFAGSWLYVVYWAGAADKHAF